MTPTDPIRERLASAYMDGEAVSARMYNAIRAVLEAIGGFGHYGRDVDRLANDVRDALAEHLGVTDES